MEGHHDFKQINSKHIVCGVQTCIQLINIEAIIHTVSVGFFQPFMEVQECDVLKSLQIRCSCRFQKLSPKFPSLTVQFIQRINRHCKNIFTHAILYARINICLQLEQYNKTLSPKYLPYARAVIRKLVCCFCFGKRKHTHTHTRNLHLCISNWQTIKHTLLMNNDNI